MILTDHHCNFLPKSFFPRHVHRKLLCYFPMITTRRTIYSQLSLSLSQHVTFCTFGFLWKNSLQVEKEWWEQNLDWTGLDVNKKTLRQQALKSDYRYCCFIWMKSLWKDLLRTSAEAVKSRSLWRSSTRSSYMERCTEIKQRKKKKRSPDSHQVAEKPQSRQTILMKNQQCRRERAVRIFKDTALTPS